MAVFFVNGTEVNVPKNQKLLRYLRDELHLTSVKDGCSEGACGACTVLIDGEPCRACTPSTDALEGRHILTVEGLTDEEKKLYAYAYSEAGAVRCEFLHFPAWSSARRRCSIKIWTPTKKRSKTHCATTTAAARAM
ncbi:MAG: 2Fe-2S iron-sulfur cluster-binding protein [Oscillospiraceae bacterium]